MFAIAIATAFPGLVRSCVLIESIPPSIHQLWRIPTCSLRSTLCAALALVLPSAVLSFSLLLYCLLRCTLVPEVLQFRVCYTAVRWHPSTPSACAPPPCGFVMLRFLLPVVSQSPVCADA